MSAEKQQVSDQVVDAIKASVATETITIDEREFVTRPVFDPPAPSRVETLAIATLTGLIEFVKSQRGRIVSIDDEASLIIQVEGPNTVAVKGPISDDRSKARDVFARATAQNPFAKGFRLGQFMALSDLNIALMTLFDTGSDRDAIVALLGNVQGSQVVEGADDGFSQAVTVRRGVVKVGEEQVKNPVTLYPFRTFAETSAVSSQFVLRLKGDPDNEEPPAAALFEADGGAWERDAIERIASHLKENLPDEVVIG